MVATLEHREKLSHYVIHLKLIKHFVSTILKEIIISSGLFITETQVFNINKCICVSHTPVSCYNFINEEAFHKIQILFTIKESNIQ